MKIERRWWLAGAALVILAAIVLALVNRKPKIDYVTAAVERGDVHDAVEATGSVNAVTTVQGGSNVIGVIELIVGVLLAVRPWWPRASVIGSLGATIAFVITFSFLFTTPDLSPAWSGFLMKDLVLLTASFYLLKQDVLRASLSATPSGVSIHRERPAA